MPNYINEDPNKRTRKPKESKVFHSFGSCFDGYDESIPYHYPFEIDNPDYFKQISTTWKTNTEHPCYPLRSEMIEQIHPEIMDFISLENPSRQDYLKFLDITYHIDQYPMNDLIEFANNKIKAHLLDCWKDSKATY